MDRVGKAEDTTAMTDWTQPAGRPYKLWLRIGLGLTFIAVLVASTDLEKLGAYLAQINFWWLAAAYLSQFVGVVVWGIRWTSLLKIYNMPTSMTTAMKGIMVGLFFNSFLPTGFGGDFYRSYWILGDKQNYRHSLFIAFIERFSGVVFLGYIVLVGATVMLWRGLKLTDSYLLLAVALICASAVLLHPKVAARVDRLLFTLSPTLLKSWRQKGLSVLEALDGAGRQKWIVYLSSLAMQFLGIFLYYSVGRAIGLPLLAWHYLVIVPFVVLFTMLPISVNGIGSRETALLALAHSVGVAISPAQIVAFGIVWAFATMVVALVGGGIYIVGKAEPSTDGG